MRLASHRRCAALTHRDPVVTRVDEAGPIPGEILGDSDTVLRSIVCRLTGSETNPNRLSAFGLCAAELLLRLHLQGSRDSLPAPPQRRDAQVTVPEHASRTALTSGPRLYIYSRGNTRMPAAVHDARLLGGAE